VPSDVRSLGPRSTAAAVRPPTAHRLHLVVAVAGIAFGLTAPLTAVFAVHFGATALLAGLAVSSLSFAVLLLDTLGTRWLPRLEPRRTLSIALLVFGAGSLVSAIAPNLAVMILARVGQGLGAALFTAVGPQLAVRIAAAGTEGQALGRFNAAWFLGIALGPLLGGALAGVGAGGTGLRLAFAVCAAVSVVGAVVVLLLLPAMPTGLRPRLSLPRFPDLAAPRPVLALGIGGVGQSLRSGVAMTLLPLIGAQQLELSGLALGGVLSVLALCDVAAMFVGGQLSDRIGRLPVLVGSLGAGVVGAVIGCLALATDSAGLFVVACAFLGTAVGAAWVLPMASVVDLAARPESGLAAYRIAADLGMGAGGVAAGAGVGAWGPGGALLACAVVLVGLAASAAVLRETCPGGVARASTGLSAEPLEPAVGSMRVPSRADRLP
jgi:MFS family permease